MGSIEEAPKTAGAEHDLQTILRVLEDKPVGFTRREAAAGPFANLDTATLTRLTIRMVSAIKRAQQQHQGWSLSARFRFTVSIFCACKSVSLHLAFEQRDSLFCGSVAQGFAVDRTAYLEGTQH